MFKKHSRWTWIRTIIAPLTFINLFMFFHFIGIGPSLKVIYTFTFVTNICEANMRISMLDYKNMVLDLITSQIKFLKS
jgi:hypothetical protein